MDRPDTRSLWDANAPAWIEMSRAGYDVYRDFVNTPAFFAALPTVSGSRCLDLGCGEGHNSRLLLARGASVVAVDIAEAFVRAARDAGPEISHVLADGAVVPFAPASFDAVTAFMSLMDIADPEATLAEIARVLRPGGFVQFSILHPMTSTPMRRWIRDGHGRKEALAVGGYFDERPITETWTFGAAPPGVRERVRPFTITYAHRTISGWLNAVARAGLCIEAVAEPHADEAVATDHPDVADTRVAPFFLIVRARRP